MAAFRNASLKSLHTACNSRNRGRWELYACAGVATLFGRLRRQAERAKRAGEKRRSRPLTACDLVLEPLRRHIDSPGRPEFESISRPPPSPDPHQMTSQPGPSTGFFAIQHFSSKPAAHQTSRYGEMPFFNSWTISAAYSALLVTKSYRLLSVAL